MKRGTHISPTSYAFAATLLLPHFACGVDAARGQGDAAAHDARYGDAGETVVVVQRDSGGDDAAIGDPLGIEEDDKAAGDSPLSSRRSGAGERRSTKSEQVGYFDAAWRYAYTQLRTGTNHGQGGVFGVDSVEETAGGPYADDVEYGPRSATKDATRVAAPEPEPDVPLDGTKKETIVFEANAAVPYPDTGSATHCRFVKVPPVEIGSEHGPFVIVDLVAEAETTIGVYTFDTISSNPAIVDLSYHDGDRLSSYSRLEYDRTVTVGAGTSVTFKFPGVLTIEVTRSKGSSNLFELEEVLFNGMHDLAFSEVGVMFGSYRWASP